MARQDGGRPPAMTLRVDETPAADGAGAASPQPKRVMPESRMRNGTLRQAGAGQEASGLGRFLDAFLGLWSVSRRIEDRRGGQEGAFRGTARFAVAGEGVNDAADEDGTGRLRYHEDGTLTLGRGMPLRATRDYLWRLADGRIVVDHGDGRVFHAFDPAQPRAEHLCGQDLYQVEYDFSRWPQWRTIWVVSGPAKDYRMTTDYEPAPAAPPPAVTIRPRADPGDLAARAPSRSPSPQSRLAERPELE